jgi:BNR/Asp-box repeat.
MKRTLCLPLIALALWSCTTTSKPLRSSSETGGRRPKYEGATEFRQMRLADETGHVAPGAFANALKQQESMKLRSPHTEGAGVSRASWTWLGPGNVGGRVTSIVNTSANPDVILINNPGGGIWRSVDRGSTWKPVNDFMANLAVSALAASPTDPNTMYAGTGGGPNAADESFGTQLRGAGIFKSIDGGSSWQQLPATAAGDWSRGVEHLAISPDGQTVLAAVKFYYGDFPAAIMRSTDGGNSWTDTLKTNRSSGFSVEFHPVDANRAVASSLTKAYTSADGGASWQEATGLPDPGSQGLITLAYARSTPDVVYAGVNVNGGEVYKSSDGGKSYSLVNTGTNYVGTQGWYCNVLWVDPVNADQVVVAGLDAFRSTDGGKTFTKISKWEKPSTKSAHADHGVVVAAAGYDGKSNKSVFFGNDGGIYRVQDIDTVEEGAGWELLNSSLGITQLYGAAVNSAGVIVAGAQDNGTQRYSGNLNKWAEWQGGDGGYCAADPTNPNIFYGEYTNMTIYRSDDGGVARPDDIYGIYDFFDGSQWVKKTRPGAITEAKSGTANFIAPSSSTRTGRTACWQGHAHSGLLTTSTSRSQKDGLPGRPSRCRPEKRARTTSGPSPWHPGTPTSSGSATTTAISSPRAMACRRRPTGSRSMRRARRFQSAL